MQQGRKAQFLVDKILRKWSFSKKEQLDLYSKMVIPVVTYGSELWEAGDVHELMLFQRA